MTDRAPVLLVIAPTYVMARAVAKDFGIDPVLARGLRTVTRPVGLRG